MSEARLHIEIVTDTFAPDINGVARTLGNLCTGMRVQGHRVEIIRSGKPAGPHETGVPGWALPGYREIRVGAPFPGWFAHRWRKEKPDAIYVAIESPLGYSAAAAAGKLGIPVVAGFHTHFREYLHKYGIGWFGECVWKYQRWFHNRLALTLAPSPVARKKLVDAGFERVEVLGRGVNARLFAPEKRDRELRATWGAGDDAPVALIAGRVSAEKNIGLAMAAFRRMKEQCPDSRCLVVGDGPARARMEREFSDGIFTGYLTGEELARHYASADILLFSSETETFGNVILETMACGVAIAAYDDAAAAWHGIDGGNLLKAQPGDEAGFIAAALRALDPGLRRKLANGGRRTALSLSWESLVTQWEEIFRRVAGK